MQVDIVKIYALVHPLTSCVFYVGASLDPGKRFWAHMYDANYFANVNSYKAKKIKEIKSIGYNVFPILKILELCSPEEGTNKENYYIRLYNLNQKTSNYSSFYKKMQDKYDPMSRRRQ